MRGVGRAGGVLQGAAVASAGGFDPFHLPSPSVLEVPLVRAGRAARRPPAAQAPRRLLDRDVSGASAARAPDRVHRSTEAATRLRSTRRPRTIPVQSRVHAPSIRRAPIGRLRARRSYPSKSTKECAISSSIRVTRDDGTGAPPSGRRVDFRPARHDACARVAQPPAPCPRGDGSRSEGGCSRRGPRPGRTFGSPGVEAGRRAPRSPGAPGRGPVQAVRRERESQKRRGGQWGLAAGGASVWTPHPSGSHVVVSWPTWGRCRPNVCDLPVRVTGYRTGIRLRRLGDRLRSR